MGGSERKTVRIVNALRRKGFNVHLGFLNGPETLLPDIDSAVPVVGLNRRGKFSYGAALRLRKYVLEHEIVRIVCVNLYPLLYAYSLRLLIGSGAPACVVSVNTTHFLDPKEAGAMFIYASIIRRVEKILFGCRYQLEHWVHKYRLPRSNCIYLYNGVDVNLYSRDLSPDLGISTRNSLGIDHADFVIGTVGQLRPEKHQGDLVAAVERLRSAGINAAALIIGDGKEADSIRRLAEKLEVNGYVHLGGVLSDVRPALAAMDVFVLTSLSETFSNAALEAMSMGVPVVLSDVGGAREMVWPGTNGYLFEKANVIELTEVLKKLADRGDERRHMGNEARRIAVERFSFTHMLEQYEELLFQA